MATHFSILAWKIAQTEEPGRLQSIGSQRVDITEGLNMHTLELQCCVLFRQQLSDLGIHIPFSPPDSFLKLRILSTAFPALYHRSVLTSLYLLVSVYQFQTPNLSLLPIFLLF